MNITSNVQVATSPVRAKPCHYPHSGPVFDLAHNTQYKYMQLLSLHVHLLFLGTNFKWKKKKLMLTIEVMGTSVVFSWWSFYKENQVKECPYRSKIYLPVSSWWPHSVIYKMGTILRTLPRQQKTLLWEVSFTFLQLVIFSSNLSLVYSSISLSIQLFILVSNLPVNEIPSQ